MRIFVLLSRIPYPLEKGDKLRAFNQIKILSQKHEIILCALNTSRKKDKQKAFESLQPYCRSVNFIDLPFTGRVINVLKAYFTGLPLQVGYFFNKKAQKKINQLIVEYRPDHLYGQLTRVASYLIGQQIKKTLDYQDAFSYGLKIRAERSRFPKNILLKMEHHRLAKFEHYVFNFFDLKTIISEQDRNHINHPKKSTIKIIKNGVDFDFFYPKEAVKNYDIVFTGNMNYPPNVDAAQFLIKDIMPKIWAVKQQTKVLIAGANPNVKVRQLKNQKVTISGWMEDIRSAYYSSKVFIAPMRLGTGLQNKLLEAMSMKIPTVTTPLANQALNAVNNKEIMIGDDAQQLAEKILLILENKSLQKTLTENAYSFVHKNHSWAAITNSLEQFISAL